MASYTEISNISRNIMELMQGELVPELIPAAEYIGLAGPYERDNLMVGVFLYDIQESTEIRGNRMINKDVNTLRYPPLYLNLYYMVTVYIEGDIQFRALREEMILGRILRLFHDNPEFSAREEEIPAKIEYMALTPEEKSKAWSFASIPYRLSAFYKVSPVTIDSAREREVSRVTNVDIRVTGGKRRQALKDGNFFGI